MQKKKDCDLQYKPKAWQEVQSTRGCLVLTPLKCWPAKQPFWLDFGLSAELVLSANLSILVYFNLKPVAFHYKLIGIEVNTPLFIWVHPRERSILQ